MTACVCGCGEPSVMDRTFAPGHNRRTQGILLAQLAIGAPDPQLLARYVGSLTKPPTHIQLDLTFGSCFCNCGKATLGLFAPGHSTRASDALLCAAAGQPVDFGTHDYQTVLSHWRLRALTNRKLAARSLKYRSHSGG